MFIDTHCHISKEYYDDIEKLVKDNRNNNVLKVVISGCEINSQQEAIELANQYEDIYLALGFHPSEVDKIKEKDIKDLEKNLEHQKVVALGEIGLDYHYGKENKKEQLALFEKQLKIAEQKNLPVVIHSRDATMDTINTLKKYKVKGIIHCFSGSLETACEYIKMGFLLGIGGVVTFKNSNLAKVIEKVDLSNIVLETDSPYLAPTPHRGEKNSSKYIPLIAEKIAQIKRISIDEVRKQTTINAEKLLHMK